MLARPEFFIEDGNELPSHWNVLVDRTEAEQPPDEWDVTLMHDPEPLEAHEVRVLARAIVAGVGGGKHKQLVQLEKGQVFAASSEIVAQIPGAFEESENAITRPKGRRR